MRHIGQVHLSHLNPNETDVPVQCVSSFRRTHGEDAVIDGETHGPRSVAHLVDTLGVIVISRAWIACQGSEHGRRVIAQALTQRVIAIDGEHTFVGIGRKAASCIRMRVCICLLYTSRCV